MVPDSLGTGMGAQASSERGVTNLALTRFLLGTDMGPHPLLFIGTWVQRPASPSALLQTVGYPQSSCPGTEKG